ncbi:MAG TPA: hypothetical protein VGE02_11745 [Gemmatimonadales bacterium]
MSRHPALATALMGAALSMACAGPSGELVNTAPPEAAPFLGDGSTAYEGAGPQAATTAAGGAPDSPGAPAAVAPATPNGIGDAVRRALDGDPAGALLVMRRGADTLCVEHVRRDGRTMHSSLALSHGVTVDYSILEHADGTAERMEVTISRSGEDGPHERFWANFVGDSIMSRTARVGHPTVNGAYRLPGSVVTYIEQSPAMLEQMVRHARRSQGSITNVSVLVLGDPSVVIGGAIVFQGDTALVAFGDMVSRLAVDGEGRVLGGSMPEEDITIERVELDTPPAAVVRRP